MESPRGAYGFRLIYPSGLRDLQDLVELDASAPSVTIEWRLASTIKDYDYVDESRVSMGSRGASSFHVTRDPAGIVFDLAAPPTPDALVHPLTTVPMAILARWRGDVTLHAGAFATEGGAWGVAGDREAGKSTMLGILGKRGYPIVADDLLAVVDGLVWSGPHCVDLRPDVAARLSDARSLGILGRRVRYRLSAPAAPPRLPLRGFFLLAWGDGPVTLEPLGTQERLQWLYRLEYIGLLGAADPARILDLLQLPAWRLTRPREWEATEAAAERMIAEVTA